MTRVRLFIVDGHPLVREGLKRLIERHAHLELVGEADDGAEASELIVRARPDIAFVSDSLSGPDAVQTTRLLKQLCPPIRIIALSDQEHRGPLREIFEAGASGYLLKRAALEEVLHAIRTVAAQGMYVDPRVAPEVMSGFLRSGGAVASVRGSKLTDRETEVLRRIAQGYSNKEIATSLGLSVKTVETYKMRAMDKLGLQHRADLVRHAAKSGWLTER